MISWIPQKNFIENVRHLLKVQWASTISAPRKRGEEKVSIVSLNSQHSQMFSYNITGRGRAAKGTTTATKRKGKYALMRKDWKKAHKILLSSNCWDYLIHTQIPKIMLSGRHSYTSNSNAKGTHVLYCCHMNPRYTCSDAIPSSQLPITRDVTAATLLLAQMRWHISIRDVKNSIFGTFETQTHHPPKPSCLRFWVFCFFTNGPDSLMKCCCRKHHHFQDIIS